MTSIKAAGLAVAITLVVAAPSLAGITPVKLTHAVFFPAFKPVPWRDVGSLGGESVNSLADVAWRLHRVATPQPACDGTGCRARDR